MTNILFCGFLLLLVILGFFGIRSWITFMFIEDIFKMDQSPYYYIPFIGLYFLFRDWDVDKKHYTM